GGVRAGAGRRGGARGARGAPSPPLRGVPPTLDAILGGRVWEARIEAELMRRRARPAHPDAAAPEPEPTPLRSPEVVDLLEPPKHTIVCPQCGKEMEADASFCSSCGASLSDLTPDTPETLTRQRTEVNG
ncbi:MAG: zinc ribbon domain-containing protein, partial [Myxococcota bacterium]